MFCSSEKIINIYLSYVLHNLSTESLIHMYSQIPYIAGEQIDGFVYMTSKSNNDSLQGILCLICLPNIMNINPYLVLKRDSTVRSMKGEQERF